MIHRPALAAAAGLALVALVAWAASGGEGPGRREAEGALTTSTFRVVGMTCGGCEVAVRHAVKKLPGVQEAEASYAEGTATVTYQADEVTPDDIIAAIEELGYEAALAGEEEGEG